MGAPQFTPGPWFAAEQLEPMGGCLSRLVMATDTGVAEVLFDDEDDPTAEANANLIAAAPELYEALEMAAAKFRDYQQMHEEKARAANPGGSARSMEGEAGLRWSKADRNRIYAEQCEIALRKARGEVA